MIKILNTGEVEQLKKYIGNHIDSHQNVHGHECVAIENYGYYITFNYFDVKNPHKKFENISIYCDKSNLVCLCDNEKCKEILGKIPNNENCFLSLTKFFYSLTQDDIFQLEYVENDINELELSLLKNKNVSKNVSKKIINLRRSLLKIKRYYEQIQMITEHLSENVNGAIDTEILPHYSVLNHQLDHLTQFVVNLREAVTQVREAYQAQIDIEQNNIMKLFTVLTSIFMPLTLVTGWYGMNIIMPEFKWNFGYLYVIILSVIVVSICFIIFKKKKWF